MKQFGYLLFFCLIFLLVGCANQSQEKKQTTKTEKSEPSTTTEKISEAPKDEPSKSTPPEDKQKEEPEQPVVEEVEETPEPPPKEENPIEKEPLPPPAEKPEPEPKADEVSKPEPQPESEREPEPEPQPEPVPQVEEEAEASEEEFQVSDDAYKKAFDDTETIIRKLNEIIKKKDYSSWLSYLTEGYKNKYSDQALLRELSKQPTLQKYNITLKTLRDYFFYVVSPSRANAKLDQISFIDENHLKAIMKIDSNSVILYLLEKRGDEWKICTKEEAYNT